jgi:hypothetical protein
LRSAVGRRHNLVTFIPSVGETVKAQIDVAGRDLALAFHLESERHRHSAAIPKTP